MAVMNIENTSEVYCNTYLTDAIYVTHQVIDALTALSGVTNETNLNDVAAITQAVFDILNINRVREYWNLLLYWAYSECMWYENPHVQYFDHSYFYCQNCNERSNLLESLSNIDDKYRSLEHTFSKFDIHLITAKAELYELELSLVHTASLYANQNMSKTQLSETLSTLQVRDSAAILEIKNVASIATQTMRLATAVEDALNELYYNPFMLRWPLYDPTILSYTWFIDFFVIYEQARDRRFDFSQTPEEFFRAIFGTYVREVRNISEDVAFKLERFLEAENALQMVLDDFMQKTQLDEQFYM